MGKGCAIVLFDVRDVAMIAFVMGVAFASAFFTAIFYFYCRGRAHG